MNPTRSSPTASKRFVFFAGKGGVGKSTCAAAAALALADEKPLALSLDPAHSLRDVAGDAKLDIIELDARQEFGRFMQAHRDDLRTVADRGTYFDDEDIRGFLDLSLPGLDEVMGLLKLGELARDASGRRVVVDLPPTGHALRLFDVSTTFERLVEALELMEGKHRFAVSSLTRRYVRDAIDGFVEELRASCEGARHALVDPRTSAFVLVCRPEPLVLAETVRLAERLQAVGAGPAALVMNAAAPASPPLPASLAALPRVDVPWLEQPPLGARGLRPVAEAIAPLVGARTAESRTGQRRRSSRTEPLMETAARRKASNAGADGKRAPVMAASPERGSLRMLLEKPRRLTIVGGKGGVGKTTVAAALALGLARRDAARPVVVVSIDPAHSLGDSFGQELGDEPRHVDGQANLLAIELDPAKHWSDFKAHWEMEGEQMFGGAPSGRLDPVYDREIAARFGSIQPTGLDELAAATSVAELIDQDGSRLVVVDTAPTGHLLRFLETPQLAIDWSKELMRLLLKYGLASQMKRLSRDLLDLSRKAKRLQALVHDPELCEVLVVTLPEGPVVAETERLIDRLGQMKVQVNRLVVNQDRPSSEVGRLREGRPELELVPIGRRERPILGIEMLAELAA